MDRIARKTAALSIVIFASLALAVSCSQTLELRDFVEQRVIAAKTPGSPQIVLAQGATEIASGGSIAIGSAVSLTSKELEFTVSNPGTASLSLTGTPLVAITGTSQAEFSIAIAPSASVVVDGNTTFTLRFSPTSTGDKEITLTITNNTAVNPDFSFVVTATATAAPAPLLQVTQGATVVSNADTYAFAPTISTQTLDVTFTITNAGTADLVLGATPVQIAGTNSANFTLQSTPLLTLLPAGTTTFTLRFSPTAVQAFSGTVNVNSNDPAFPAFAFSVAGNGTEWHGIKTVMNKAAYSAKIGYNGDNVYILYYDSVSPGKLMLIKSADRAATWGTPFTVDGTPGNYSTSNNMVVDNSNLYITYQRVDTVYFIQVTDNGSSFTSSNAKTVSTLSVYAYGYENSIAIDAQNVYIAYSAGGGPAFTYAAKGASMTFSAPKFIDSGIDQNTGNRKKTSIYIDSSGNVNVAYFDAFGSGQLRRASFAPADVLPMTVSGLVTASITDADSPSMATQRLISFYDPTAKSYRLFEHYSYTSGMLLLFKINTVTIDNSSANVGQSGVLVNQSPYLYTAYYDVTNKVLKFAVGIQPSASSAYAFTSKVLASVGGSNFACSFVSNQALSTFYIVFYDSTGTGALKVAKSLDNGVTW